MFDHASKKNNLVIMEVLLTNDLLNYIKLTGKSDLRLKGALDILNSFQQSMIKLIEKF